MFHFSIVDQIEAREFHLGYKPNNLCSTYPSFDSLLCRHTIVCTAVTKKCRKEKRAGSYCGHITEQKMHKNVLPSHYVPGILDMSLFWGHDWNMARTFPTKPTKTMVRIFYHGSIGAMGSAFVRYLYLSQHICNAYPNIQREKVLACHNHQGWH